ncbi:MAG: preprotein translocase subunit SecE [Hyphomicrobiaceae bacterium]
MASTSPLEFMRQVRAEVAKVTWPTRRETMITTVMVMIMVLFAALFFLATDQVMSRLVSVIIGLGR